MNCRQIQRELTCELEARFEDEVAAHLQVCSECRRLCRDLVELKELAGELEEVPSSQLDLIDEVMAEVAATSAWRRVVFRPLAASFLLAALSAALVFYFGGKPGMEKGFEAGLRVDSVKVAPERLETPYLDVPVGEPNESEYILRVPAVIQVQQTDLHEDAYFLNVSH